MVIAEIDARGQVSPREAAREHACDRVLMTEVWTRLRDPLAALCEAARLLREDGRLLVVERRTRIGFREMVRLLENNGWGIHGYRSVGDQAYALEAAVTDESVQS